MNGDLGLAGLLGLLGFVAFGSVIPVVPTGAAVSAAAVLARAEQPWELVLVVAFGAGGAYLGDLITYTVLRSAGPPLAQRVGWLHADDPDGALRQMVERIETDEVRALLLSRLVPGGRLPVLLAASLGGYPLRRFVSANVGAALLWAAVYATIGVVGDALIPDPTIAVLVVVAFVVLLGLVLPRVKQALAKRPERGDTPQAPAVRPAEPE